MNRLYDYEWITKDINDSIAINLIDQFKVSLGAFEAIDVINIVGDDVRISEANINDLTNLINLGAIRFKSYTNENYIDIPIRNLYKLLLNPNVLSINGSAFPNNIIPIQEMDATASIDNALVLDSYGIIATKINEYSPALKKMIEIASEYGNMGMNEKFNALSEINDINIEKEK